VTRLVGVLGSEHIREAEVEERLHACALFVRVEDPAAELRFVPRVDRGGDDVEVAADDRGRIRLRGCFQMRRQRLEPRELRGEIRVSRV
jgi:hypothetical protein